MKISLKRPLAMALVLAVVLLAATACGSEEKPAVKDTTPVSTSGETTPAPETVKAEPTFVEFWYINNQGITWEKEGPVSQWLVERTGVGMYSPLVIWEGGTGYFSKLQTRIATGDVPDIFIPLNSIESALAKDGMIWELSEYLPKYAPHIWELIPSGIWDQVRANDPTGKGGIYYIPDVKPYTDYGTFIRKDWLDNAGLEVPTNQADYVEALRAFKKMDPDSLPTIGRELGRWMDHLFFMYDIAMFEGYPQFDIYNGEITYSGVTPNMKEALKFVRSLYEEKLLDNETFLNKANDLWAKVTNSKVGSWYHIPKALGSNVLNDLTKVTPDANVVLLPKIAAPGYDGRITVSELRAPRFSFGKGDEEVLIASLKMLDWMADEANLEEILFGVKGLHYSEENGKKTAITGYDVNTVEKRIEVGQVIMTKAKLIKMQELLIDGSQDDLQKNINTQVMKALEAAENGTSRVMAQDGMPSTVFEGYPDISSHKLYQEYMTKIIIGELPLDAFDEFVEKWYKSGGTEVTQRVREWYKTYGRK